MARVTTLEDEGAEIGIALARRLATLTAAEEKELRGVLRVRDRLTAIVREHAKAGKPVRC